MKHSVSNGKRHVSNVNKRAKMFAVCAWTQIAVMELINVQKLLTLASRSWAVETFLTRSGKPTGAKDSRDCSNGRFFSKRFLIELITMHVRGNIKRFSFPLIFGALCWFVCSNISIHYKVSLLGCQKGALQHYLITYTAHES